MAWAGSFRLVFVIRMFEVLMFEVLMFEVQGEGRLGAAGRLRLGD
jgi:hypothetical protein